MLKSNLLIRPQMVHENPTVITGSLVKGVNEKVTVFVNDLRYLKLAEACEAVYMKQIFKTHVPCIQESQLAGGWPARFLKNVEELNSGPPKTN